MISFCYIDRKQRVSPLATLSVKTNLLFAAFGLIVFSTAASRADDTRATPPRHTLVLRYQDFAPQAAAFELIGFEWYQWNSQGPDNPSQPDTVRVVVYRDIPLNQVKKLYPVIRGQQDYRYISYHDALAYCGRLLREHGALLGHLRHTRNTIHEHLDR